MKWSDIVKAGDENYKLITFSWDLVDICQYKCSYCSSMNFNLHTFKHKKDLRHAWKKVVKILSLKRIKSDFSVELLGGEPTLHPDILEILQEINSIPQCAQIELITNLAKPQKFYEQLANKKYSKVCIIASYHPEYYSEEYFNKVVNLNAMEGINVYPNINLSDESTSWESTKNLIERFQQENVQVSLNLLQSVNEGKNGGWEPKYSQEFYEYFERWLGDSKSKFNLIKKDVDRIKDYSPMTAQIPYFKKNGDVIHLSEAEINKYNFRTFKGWECKNLMYHITMDGVFKDHCTNIPISVYNISENYLTSCVTCPLENCDCDTKFLYVKKLQD